MDIDGEKIADPKAVLDSTKMASSKLEKENS